ncbi:hypothetical protein C8R47DRAFT_1079682 [Mycena vitilis]|nr:hypothetical protein C8R47DRAFT_1079682 [Mycena vitilis]
MDFDFDFNPAWSEHTIHRRGKAVLLDVIEQELENSDRRFIAEAPFRTVAWYLRETSPILAETDTEGDVETTTHDDTDSDRGTDLDTTGPPQTSSEPDTDLGEAQSALDDSDDEKMLPSEVMDENDDSASSDSVSSPAPFNFGASAVPSAEWSEGFISHFSPYPLHQRELSPLQAMTSIPDTVSVAHLEMIGFKKIVWDDPRPFVDLQDRIGAFFLGPPHQRTKWETAIMATTDAMRSVRHSLGPIPDETLRGGFKHGAKGVENFTYPDSHLVALAKLRHSAGVQEITSFQNAALKELAPELWAAANKDIDTVMGNDSTLRLPFHQCLGLPSQPTAFSQVEYLFHLDDSHSRQHLRDRATGWTAVTSVGDYDAKESALILWRERRVVRFPPGSTFLFPAGLFSYSFTGISEYSSWMLIIQSFDGEIARFVEGGMSDKPKLPNLFTDDAWKVDRQRRARRAIAIFPTLNEYDSRSHRWAMLEDPLNALRRYGSTIDTPILMDATGRIQDPLRRFGSTIATPIVMDATGRIDLRPPRSPSGRVIRDGGPSAIRQDTPRYRLPRGRGPILMETAAQATARHHAASIRRRARQDENRPPPVTRQPLLRLIPYVEVLARRAGKRAKHAYPHGDRCSSDGPSPRRVDPPPRKAGRKPTTSSDSPTLAPPHSLC